MDITKQLQALSKAERFAILRAVNNAKGGVINADELRQQFPEIAPGTLWAQTNLLVTAGLIEKCGAGRYKPNPFALVPLLNALLAAFGREEWQPNATVKEPNKGATEGGG